MKIDQDIGEILRGPFFLGHPLNSSFTIKIPD